MPIGSGLTASLDELRFYRALAVFRDELKIEPKKLVQLETRLLLTQIVKFTPPKSLAQGRAAVARDVQRAMQPLDDTKFTSKKISTAIRNKDVNSMREIVRRIPSMKSFTVETFDPVRLHRDKRDSRGRIQRSKNVFVLDKKGWKEYAKAEQKNVGSARAGYWPGLQAVGGSVPSWVARHTSKFGAVDISKLANPGNPTIRVQNFAYAARSQNDQNHTVQSALRMRARSMESNARRMIHEAAQKSGLSVH